MGRLLVVVCLLFVGCGGDDPTTVAEPSEQPSQEVAASPSPTFDYCSDFGQIGALRGDIRKGTETADELIDEADRLQDSILATGNADLQDVADALGSLTVSLDIAGPAYSYDRAVRLRAKTMSIAAVTAAFALQC